MDEYFRTLVTWIDLQLFFPPSFFPNRPEISGGFYCPGGWLLGALLTVNLLAAHGIRFKIQAEGQRLVIGLVAIALGVLVITSIVMAGAGHDGLRQAAWIGWPAVWRVFQACLGLSAAALLVSAGKLKRERKAERRMLTLVAAVLATGLLWTLYNGEQGRLDDSSLRILWQLGKGTLAGAVLLFGCVMIFKRRAGVVLLHGGIGLMMLSELLVGLTAEESQMRIREGETVNYTYDIRNLELAVIDKSQPGRHEIVSVPESLLRDGRMIRHPDLPFDIRVVQFMNNSEIRMAGPNEPNPANSGVGLRWIAESKRPLSGTDASGAVDQAAVYLQLFDKRTAEDLGTHLAGLVLSAAEMPDTATVDGKTWNLYLRFKRHYKPYALTLIDVRKDDYPGTDTPRNYSSEVRLVDPAQNVDRETKIWMNNPLRFSGETFYQTQYFREPETGFESTTLSVVGNSSWMLPYVACMIVAMGMLAHFGAALMKFVRRRSSEVVPPASGTDGRPLIPGKIQNGGWLRWALPALVVLLTGGWLISKARPPHEPSGEMQLYEFGKLPVVFQGRLKPIDTLARNSLQILNDRQTFEGNDGSRQPAIRWLLDLITRPGDEAGHRVFRIDNTEVLDSLGLQRRKGLRYSYAELQPKSDEIHKQARLARSLDPAGLAVYQKKILALDNKLGLRDLLVQSFVVAPAEGAGGPSDLQAVLLQQQLLSQRQPPLCVPPTGDAREWQAYATARAREILRGSGQQMSGNPPLAAWSAILAASAANDSGNFNEAVASYRTSLATETPGGLDRTKLDFEAFFNHFAPFYLAAILYLVAFILTAIGWLGWSAPLNRTAFWLILLTLGLHTFALAARIYISGRPPVTNLYSSAVFIGWGCVVLGVVLERIYRNGMGIVICSVTGFSTLLVAQFLAGDGDTFAVLQAVLDTQFWLATHVVCITLGYATTLVAGLLGILYILRGALTPSLSSALGRQLATMIYGTLCFAILFSFVGTVLGGLWADDSWGRFWGWDPKENGALIIVLWNALVLHARWGGLIRQRGLANLAVAGNIAVCWSWFGVNELGVGLHSYGFTEGVLRTLGIFIITQLAIIGLGLLPANAWWSNRRQQAELSPDP
jgi:ABC-type transport system involved in cytochrome c biogenesis permease subunit